MPIHPLTADGYFKEGNPLTGYRPTQDESPSLEFFNALLDLLDAIGYGPPVDLTEESTLTATQFLIVLLPPADATVYYHLPVYASVSVAKRYRLVNLGQGIARIDAADAKTVDGEGYIELVPGDKSGDIFKYADNWRTA